MQHRLRRLLVPTLVTFGVIVPGASADTLSLSASAPQTSSTPATNGAKTYTITATASSAALDSNGNGPYLYVIVQPGSSCYPTFGDDSQAAGAAGHVLDAGKEIMPGNVTEQFQDTETGQGPEIVCGYLENQPGDEAPPGQNPEKPGLVVLASASTQLQAPTPSTLSITVPEGTHRERVPVPLQFSGSAILGNSRVADAKDAYLYVDVHGAGVPCATTFGSDRRQTLRSKAIFDGDVVPPGSFRRTNRLAEATGSYTVCAWLEDVRGDDQAEEGDASPDASDVLAATSHTVHIAPPLRCLVPRLKGLGVAGARRALQRAGCNLGRVRRRHVRGVRAGHVIAVSPAPGRRLRGDAPVNVTLSR